MHYKTIVLELLQEQYPTLHGRLKAARTLPAALDRHAADLRRAHLAWTDELRRAGPERDPSRISAEALELAIQHLQGGLPPESPPAEAAGPLSLDAAMAYLRRHTPPS